MVLCMAMACSGTIAPGLAVDQDGNPMPPGQGGRSAGSSPTGGAGGSRQDQMSGGSGPVWGADAVVPSSRLLRLSHVQWENTVRDLLFLPERPGLSRSFTGDSLLSRFDNLGSSLQVTDGLFTDYQLAAEQLAERVSGDAQLRARILPPNLPSDAAARARAFVTAFGERAFRRPLDEQEIAEHVALFQAGPQAYGGGDALAMGVRAVVTAMLQSPYFLYRIERSTEARDGVVPLSGWELASRLSYALAGTMPDAQLMAAAREGRLSADALSETALASELRDHARRLLGTPAGRELVDDFHLQLLRLRAYDGIDKDRTRVPEFSPGIGADMRQEALRFVREVVLERGQGISDLLQAPFSYVNARLAPIYGVSAPAGGDFARVELNPDERFGLLTLSGFLAANAHRDEVDSIHRGVFVHHQILCTDLPAPSDDVPPLPDLMGRTNRERVTAHTGPGTCGAGCHSNLINPAGFAFEAYDAIGKYRTTDRGAPIDASGTMEIDGEERTWRTGKEFVGLLAASDDAHRCITGAWLEYLHARQVHAQDANLLGRLAERSRRDRAPLTELVVELVASRAFANRTP